MKKKTVLSLIVAIILVGGCAKIKDETPDSNVNIENTRENYKLSFDKEDLKSFLSKIASVKYYGDITEEEELNKFMSEDDAKEAEKLLMSTIGKDYIDITSDIKDYIEIKEDKENSIKNNPDKSYNEYKKRMQLLENNTDDADTGYAIENEIDTNGDDEDNENEILIHDMQIDLILPDGTVIWKGLSKRQAQIADEYDKQKYKEACKKYNLELEKILNEEESGVTNQSYNNIGGGIVKLSNTKHSFNIIKNDIMTKKEWEEAYKPYPDTIDKRITKEGDKYYIYYKDLSEDERISGVVILNVFGFDFEVDVSQEKFGGTASKGNEEYLYEVTSYNYYDNGNCEVTLSSMSNSFDIGFNIGTDGKIIDGLNVAKAVYAGIGEDIDNISNNTSSKESGEDLLNEAID